MVEVQTGEGVAVYGTSQAKPESNTNPETRNPKPETRNPKPETRLTPEARSRSS
jgi:hypothetical protein